jgi:hypothetical protein
MSRSKRSQVRRVSESNEVERGQRTSNDSRKEVKCRQKSKVKESSCNSRRRRKRSRVSRESRRVKRKSKAVKRARERGVSNVRSN